MSSVPAPVPQKNKNLLWWILGAIGGVLVLLVLIVLVVAGLFLQGVKVDQDAAKVDISTPAGQLSVGKTDSAHDVGLPIYPGANLVESGAEIELQIPGDRERVGIVALHYRTNDSLLQVDSWYRDHLSLDFERRNAGGKQAKISIQDIELGPDDIAYVSESDELVRVVGLQKTANGVEIALARVGKRNPL